MKILLNRLAAEHKAMKLAESKYNSAKSKYEATKLEVLGKMNEAGLDSLRHNNVSLSTSTVEVFSVDDWEAFYKYVLRYKATELLQRRLATNAIRDRIADGKKVPVKSDKVRRLTVTIKRGK